MSTNGSDLRSSVTRARMELEGVAFEFNRQLANREMKRNEVARLLGIDKTRLHHFSHGRMILDDEETQRLVEWMVSP